MFSNGMFEYSVRDKRCLVICDGFYEPKGPKVRGAEAGAIQVRVRGRPALCPEWHLGALQGGGDDFFGFMIVTTRPNAGGADPSAQPSSP